MNSIKRATPLYTSVYVPIRPELRGFSKRHGGFNVYSFSQVDQAKMRRRYCLAAVAGMITFYYLLVQWPTPMIALPQGNIVGKQVTVDTQAATGRRTFKQDHFLGSP